MLGANRPRGNYEDDKTSERPFLVFLSMGKLSVGNYLRGNRLRNNYLGGNFTVSIIQGAIFCVCVCVSMCVCVFGGGGGKRMGYIYPGDKFHRDQLSLG